MIGRSVARPAGTGARALSMFEKGHLPVYYFPRDDVRFDLFEPTTGLPQERPVSSWS